MSKALQTPPPEVEGKITTCGPEEHQPRSNMKEEENKGGNSRNVASMLKWFPLSNAEWVGSRALGFKEVI
jgi:hypothetical protein